MSTHPQPGDRHLPDEPDETLVASYLHVCSFGPAITSAIVGSLLSSGLARATDHARMEEERSTAAYTLGLLREELKRRGCTDVSESGVIAWLSTRNRTHTGLLDDELRARIVEATFISRVLRDLEKHERAGGLTTSDLADFARRVDAVLAYFTLEMQCRGYHRPSLADEMETTFAWCFPQRKSRRRRK